MGSFNEKGILGGLFAKSNASAQLKKLREECAELAGVKVGKVTPNTIEEIADIEIVIDVLRSRFGRAIDIARGYKLRRMAVYLRGNFRKWADFKRKNYPGFAEPKSGMLRRVADELKRISAVQKTAKKPAKKAAKKGGKK